MAAFNKELKEFYLKAQEEGKTVKEVADELCIADASVRNYCAQHNITLRKVGNIGSGKRGGKRGY